MIEELIKAIGNYIAPEPYPFPVGGGLNYNRARQWDRITAKPIVIILLLVFIVWILGLVLTIKKFLWREEVI